MAKIIKDIGKTKRKIDAKVIANALGAEEVGTKIDTRRGPISLFSLRQFLVNQLHSTGGRPTLRGIRKKRNKISLATDDWEKLDKIAKHFKEKEGINVSSGQIASLLIHVEVSKIDTSKIEKKRELAVAT